MTQIKFVVVFSFNNHRKSVHVRNLALHDMTQGFWVTKEFRFTLGADNEWWIPPSQILYIRKVREQDPEPAPKAEAVG